MSGAEGITAYVQTRNATTDYRFVVSPSVRWWRDYLDWTQAERPSLLLIPSETPNQWKLYASAIPSTRRDYRQTPIRYTFVLEGITSKNAEFISQFIRTWFVHTREPENHVDSARALDRDFSQEFLADAFASDALDAEQHHAHVIKALVEWTNNTEASEDALNDVVRLKGGEWAGVEAKGARSAFLQWIKKALHEKRASTAAFVFNATSVDSEVDELIHRFKGDFIVLRWNDESPPSEIKKKPLQRQLVEKEQDPEPTPMRRPLIVALVILIAMMIVVKRAKKETASVLWGPIITLDKKDLANLPELPQKICHHRTPLANTPHLALTEENQVILHVPAMPPK